MKRVTSRRFARLRANLRRQREGLRCEHCGRRAHWGESWVSHGQGDLVWHDACSALIHWRRTAGERLEVLALVVEVWGVSASDVYAIAEGRAAPDPPVPHRTSEEAQAWNKAWRVFYDLDASSSGGRSDVRTLTDDTPDQGEGA